VLEEFIEWAKSVTKDQMPDLLKTEITIGNESDNRGARLDIDTSSAIARITCWQSGDYEAEILDFESGLQTYAQRGQLRDGVAIPVVFLPFLTSLLVNSKK